MTHLHSRCWNHPKLYHMTGGRPHFLLAISLPEVKKGVLQRGVPEEKTGTDGVSSSDPWHARMQYLFHSGGLGQSRRSHISNSSRGGLEEVQPSVTLGRGRATVVKTWRPWHQKTGTAGAGLLVLPTFFSQWWNLARAQLYPREIPTLGGCH